MSIFISYRRNDSADVTGRIYDRLAYSFDKDTIFKDVDSIPFGVNFRTYLSDIIEKSKIFLVVIGPTWLSITNEQGERRLDNPSDVVRIEIESALQRKIMVIPLLVSGASMPKASQLPSSLEELAFYNGIQIRPDPDFHKDMNRLIHELGNQIKPSGRESVRNYYPGSDFPEKPTSGNILDRPPAETISIAKGRVVGFIQFLPTLWGRLLVGIVLGFLMSLVFEVPGGFSMIVFGISGLISYPHRKTVRYVISGVLIAITILFLILLFTTNFSFSEISYDDMLITIPLGLMAGGIFGAIASRVQHIRQKL